MTQDLLLLCCIRPETFSKIHLYFSPPITSVFVIVVRKAQRYPRHFSLLPLFRLLWFYQLLSVQVYHNKVKRGLSEKTNRKCSMKSNQHEWCYCWWWMLYSFILPGVDSIFNLIFFLISFENCLLLSFLICFIRCQKWGVNENELQVSTQRPWAILGAGREESFSVW